MEARWIPRVGYPPTNICTRCTDTVDNRASFVILARDLSIYLFFASIFLPFFFFFFFLSPSDFPRIFRHRDANPPSSPTGVESVGEIYEQRPRKYRWTSDIYGIEECNCGLSYNSVFRAVASSTNVLNASGFHYLSSQGCTRGTVISYVIGTNCHGSFSFDYFFSIEGG